MKDSVTVHWKGGMLFAGKSEAGHEMLADARESVGGARSAPSAVEWLYFSLGACTGMDVVSLLRKMRQEVTSYDIQMEFDFQDEEWPHYVRAARVTHVLRGPNLDPALVAKAVALTNDKYCSVASSLRYAAEVTSDFVIEPS